MSAGPDLAFAALLTRVLFAPPLSIWDAENPGEIEECRTNFEEAIGVKTGTVRIILCPRQHRPGQPRVVFPVRANPLSRSIPVPSFVSQCNQDGKCNPEDISVTEPASASGTRAAGVKMTMPCGRVIIEPTAAFAKGKCIFRGDKCTGKKCKVNGASCKLNHSS